MNFTTRANCSAQVMSALDNTVSSEGSKRDLYDERHTITRHEWYATLHFSFMPIWSVLREK